MVPPDQRQPKPVIKSPPTTTTEKEESDTKSDKGMKLVLGDIVLPISQASNFSLELPFSKITVEPVK
jgi:hypothetical protein